MSPVRFLAQFFASPGRTGAVLPSSPALAELITRTAELDTARAIVEWGTGNGVFTEHILRRKPRAAAFLALELNPEMAAATRRRCPDAEVVLDSALHTRRYLRERGLERCDRVVSGLPWAAFSEGLQDELLGALHEVLAPGGVFVTFAYLQGLWLPAGRRFRAKLRARFGEVTATPTVWANVPPAFVYQARTGG